MLSGLQPVWLLLATFALAYVLDRCWGEPPARWHPVVWMGCYLAWAGCWVAPMAAGAPARRPWAEFCRGVFGWWLGALMVLASAWLLAWGVAQLPIQASVLGTAPAAVLGGVLLKPLWAWRMLRDEVQAVELALAQSLAQGREQLARLCSRDVSQLSAAQVRETAIETLAENLNDSVIAPWFWFLLLGLPGAALYRFSNTADAMWGYRGVHGGRDWTWAGRWAARVDDVLSWIPARLTAGLMVVLRPETCWRSLVRQARQTPSPNGGWPMGAMALALDVRLGKPGVYVLHPEGQVPTTGHSRQAVVLAGRVVGLAAVLSMLVMSAIGWLG